MSRRSYGAAALRVGMTTYGDPYRIEALLTLDPSNDIAPWIIEEYSGYQLPPALPGDAPVYVAIAEAFEEAGVPLAARRETRKGLELRATLATALLRVAVADNAFGIRAQHAAMNALSALSSGELVSLRSEEWLVWGEEAMSHLGEQMQADGND